MEDFIADIHLALTSFHTPHLDEFMLIISGFAEWFPWLLAIAILVFGIVTYHNTHRAELYEEVPLEEQTPRWKTIGWHALPLLAQLLSTVIVQPLKYLINAPRPLAWFAAHYPDVSLYLADQFDPDYYMSFPSGHTASAFAIATSLILMMPKNFSQGGKMIIVLFLLGCATIAGYSRIYLNQHFFHDVAAGAIIGMFAAWAVWKIWQVLQSRHSKMY